MIEIEGDIHHQRADLKTIRSATGLAVSERHMWRRYTKVWRWCRPGDALSKFPCNFGNTLANDDHFSAFRRQMGDHKHACGLVLDVSTGM